MLAECGGNNQNDAAFAFGPALGDDDGGFDGFAEAHFVGQYHAFGEGRADGEEGCIHLVRVEIYFGSGEGSREAFHFAAGAALGEEGGPVRTVEMGWQSFFFYTEDCTQSEMTDGVKISAASGKTLPGSVCVQSAADSDLVRYIDGCAQAVTGAGNYFDLRKHAALSG